MAGLPLVSRTVLVVSLFVLGAWIQDAAAQAVAVQTEIKAVTGRVEVLRQGQSQWRPAAVGMKLNEGDEIRAWSGASAQLELPDATTLVLAENSRLVVTKVAADPQNRNRVGIFHLAVGKVRASIAESAIKLVQARQANFAITTPGGVAAARGTVFVVSSDPDEATACEEPGARGAADRAP